MSDASKPAEPDRESSDELDALKAELQKARTDLERFTFFVSHDLRAPLRHISAFSGLLEAELQDHANPEIKAWLGFMGDGASLIQKLVDEVLAFSRARRAKAEVGVTKVAQMFEQLEADALVPEEGLVVGSQIDADVAITMSPDHAAQVFAHLVRNAIHFRKPLAAAQLSLSAKGIPESESWEIELRDEGIGVRAGDIAEVFEPFYRSSDSARQSPGLGLSVARHLLSLYGGSIEIESEHGVFTLVRVRVPRAES